MSKKVRKLLSKYNKYEIQNFFESIHEDARDRVEFSSGFEISRDIAELGVSTSHREGIEAIFTRVARECMSQKLPPQKAIGRICHGAFDQWQSEIKAKNRGLSAADAAFLMAAIEHYMAQWLETTTRTGSVPGLAFDKEGEFRELFQTSQSSL